MSTHLGVRILLGIGLSIAAWAETGRPLGLDLYRPVPEENPLTPGKVALGWKLFREKALSRDRSRACATCHQPKRAFTDGRAKAVGVFGRQGPRSVPTLVNRAWGESFFWDGRVPTLEEQVLQPIQAESEMDLTLEEAVERLRVKQRYVKLFGQVFGGDISRGTLADALAAYVRTIVSGDSPYDHYLFGNSKALSEDEIAGLRIFRGKGNCTACHTGPTLTDEEFHNTGVAWRGEEFLDEGQIAVTGSPEDRGKFKTPTLREIARTAPYMHDGSVAALEDVIDFYSDGATNNPNLDREIRPLHLTQTEKQQLRAFLRTLSGDIRDGI